MLRRGRTSQKKPRVSRRVNILLNTDRVGELALDNGQYVFRPGVERLPSFVPSLMAEQHVHPAEGAFLPPFLEVSLPEGHMRRVMLSRLAKLGEPEDFALLRAVGHNMIGLLRTVSVDRKLSSEEGGLKLDMTAALQMEETSLFDLAFSEEGSWPGLSGGFMKLLVATRPSSSSDRHRNWILKLPDADHPAICAVEHFGMCAASLMGLRTPETILSEDGSRLLVERFDFDDDGERLGFDDMCALSAMPARDKYAGSVERIVRLIAEVCGPAKTAASQEAFFAQYLLASVIRNGDAHLKNFGVLYGPGKQTAIAPVYDMLSMAVYAPRREDGDAVDGMALSLGGTKRWPSPAMLSGLARRCNVTQSKERFWQQRLADALIQVGLRAAKAALHEVADVPLRLVIGRMLELWGVGINPYCQSAAKHLEGLSRSLRAAN